MSNIIEDADVLPSSHVHAAGTIEFQAGALVIRGSHVWLSPKEAAIMAILTSCPDRFVSCDELLEGMYGLNDRPRSRMVDVCMSRIRSKIRKTAGFQDVIVYRRGLGWRLAPVANQGIRFEQAETTLPAQACDFLKQEQRRLALEQSLLSDGRFKLLRLEEGRWKDVSAAARLSARERAEHVRKILVGFGPAADG